MNSLIKLSLVQENSPKSISLIIVQQLLGSNIDNKSGNDVVERTGIGIVGFTSHVLLSLFPLGNTFRIEISTILSFAT